MFGQMNVMPLAMMMAGVTVTATVGKDAATRVVNTVKVSITEYELSGLAQNLKQEYIYGVDLQELTEDPAEFSAFIRENMEADKGRDPALDLWGTEFDLIEDQGGQGTGFIVYSLGPNRAVDNCGDGHTWDEDAWEEQLDDFDFSEEGLQEQAERAEPQGPDDVCHPFRVSPTDRSPYKRIKR